MLGDVAAAGALSCSLVLSSLLSDIILLKVVCFQRAVIDCQWVVYSSGASAFKICPYFKHFDIPCFQNYTS